jgi:hypothetical protein
VPEELNRRVDLLVSEVHGLREGVQSVFGELTEANERAARAEATSKRNRSWLRILGLSFVVSLVVSGLLFAGLFAFAMRNRTGQCTEWKATATQDIGPTTTELGRSLVRTAADAYRLTGCEKFLGPLGDVDPDAYRPAPS